MSKNLKCLECGGNYYECKCNTKIMNLYLRKSEAEQENAGLKAKVVKALKALDDYYKCYDSQENLHRECPICGDGDGDDCLEVAWDRWEKARRELQAAASQGNS